jgi:hypothetical protein
MLNAPILAPAVERRGLLMNVFNSRRVFMIWPDELPG